MKIYIKNMVCDRCITAVTEIFHDAGFREVNVMLGEVTVNKPVPSAKLDSIENSLNEIGFEIIGNANSRLIEQIKEIAMKFVYEHPEKSTMNFSDYLSDSMHRQYNPLSSLFSSVEGYTIEKYLIKLKIERVKELLIYDKKTLNEIAFDMGYSSLAHLSGQFKKVTGFSPTYFKLLHAKAKSKE